jgi:hypothetical protein
MNKISTFESENSPVFCKETVEFVTVANEFCLLLERAAQFGKKDFVSRSQKMLPLLYFKAAVLPEPNESIDEYYEKFVSETDWTFVEQRVSQLLGASEQFINLTLPSNLHETTELSLSECYADIYQDLKDFTLLYQTGSEDAVNEALFELKESFEDIWGPRILALTATLHNMLFGSELLDEDKNEQDISEDDDDFEDDDFHEINVKNLFSKN